MAKTKEQMEEYYGGDDPALIKMCLECKRPDCYNCIHRMKKNEKEAVRRENGRR